jgi:hypothetical protein
MSLSTPKQSQVYSILGLTRGSRSLYAAVDTKAKVLHAIKAGKSAMSSRPGVVGVFEPTTGGYRYVGSDRREALTLVGIGELTCAASLCEEGTHANFVLRGPVTERHEVASAANRFLC